MLGSLTWSLPADTTARGGRPDDLDAVLAVIHAAEELEQGAPMTSRADVRGDWQRPSIDLATDVVVVEHDDRVVAYAEQLQGRAFAHVHPDARGHGIGTALAAWSEAHARAAGLARVGQTIAATATESMALLTGRGYVPRWEAWILQTTLDDVPPEPVLPEGIVLRTLERPHDDRAVHELIDTAFEDWGDRDPSMSWEDWRTNYLDREEMDPGLVLLLAEADRLVGAALCLVDEGEGWIAQLAVVRSHRGRGLGRALLQAAFRRFRDHGLEAAWLSTDSRTGARTLYEQVGMAVTESFVRMSLPLSPDDSP